MAVVSLVFALTAFAVEGVQPPKETGVNFEQMKADHMQKLDARMNSLQHVKKDLRSGGKEPGRPDELQVET